MTLMLLVVALVVGAADPVLLIAPVIAAFFSRGRWWIVPLVALLWGGVLEIAFAQMMPDVQGSGMLMHLASALIAGLVVSGIAALIRKMRGAAPAAAPDQGTGARE